MKTFLLQIVMLTCVVTLHAQAQTCREVVRDSSGRIEKTTPSKLNLKGIDWVILGGESGSGFKFTRPFALEWVDEIRQHCRKNGVAFFCKQLGRNPTQGGEMIRLKNTHGGDWDEWPNKALKIREFPKAFHDYRKAEMMPTDRLRPIFKSKKKKH